MGQLPFAHKIGRDLLKAMEVCLQQLADILLRIPQVHAFSRKVVTVDRASSAEKLLGNKGDVSKVFVIYAPFSSKTAVDLPRNGTSGPPQGRSMQLRGLHPADASKLRSHRHL